ncbi:glutathione S-transferase T2-like [Brassica napus]|uniref:glutathione S-transferase T2-like n=1 Tax=Brassica napus TaxID=3708 RepID=UPI0006AB2887|nr:glutathione S-transferase T2-like [Brassica napus]
MDSRNPYSQYTSYVGLLHSQRENVGNENFPYESFPSSVYPGASEIPPFSFQQSEAPATPEDTPAERRERKKWTPADDEKSSTFWQRVGDYYASSPHVRAGGEKTEHNHCKQRWHKINEWMNKFCGAFAAAERQKASGQSENDVLKLAHEIYYADHKQKFTVEHVVAVSNVAY